MGRLLSFNNVTGLVVIGRVGFADQIDSQCCHGPSCSCNEPGFAKGVKICALADDGLVLASVWFTTPPERARRGYACSHGTGRERGVPGNLLTTALPESDLSAENAVSNFEAVEGTVTRKSLVKRKYRRAKRKDVKKAMKL